jgi:hypothetical protein
MIVKVLSKIESEVRPEVTHKIARSLPEGGLLNRRIPIVIVSLQLIPFAYPAFARRFMPGEKRGWRCSARAPDWASPSTTTV